VNLAAPISHPLAYALVLAGGVGLGLPMGAAVVGAGAVFGGLIGVVVVVLGQAAGLVINWNLCRHWCRRLIVRRLQRRRRWRWLLAAIDTQLSWQSLLMLRLALLPMAAVNACCALSATAWRPYALTSGVLVLRFALMVQAGALGAASVRGTLSSQQQLVALSAGVATLMAAALVARSVKRTFT
jgi:uncharacterized membrane protein YdjX (TVP38/TMEM64 family)